VAANPLLNHVRDLYARGGADAIWKWAVAADGAHGKAKRFAVLVIFARNQRNQEKDGSDAYRQWNERLKVYVAERDKYEKRYESRQEVWWPTGVVFAELLYHSPPHLHIACADRGKLIGICKVAQEQFNCRVGEFPPFDSVECVHVTSSWHYRAPGGVVLPCSSSRLDLGGDAGLAADINDLDGGSDQEYALYIELKRRYT